MLSKQTQTNINTDIKGTHLLAFMQYIINVSIDYTDYWCNSLQFVSILTKGDIIPYSCATKLALLAMEVHLQ